MDFERWFQRQGPPEQILAEKLEDIGLDMHQDGSVWGECCICHKRMCLTDYVTAEECLSDIDPADQYCGGSPRCCP